MVKGDVFDLLGSDEPEFAFDLIPPRALAQVAHVMWKGKGHKYHWSERSIQEHIGRAIGHLTAHLAGRREENHLANAACRVLFALDLLSSPAPSDREEADYLTYVEMGHTDPCAEKMAKGGGCSCGVGRALYDPCPSP